MIHLISKEVCYYPYEKDWVYMFRFIMNGTEYFYYRRFYLNNDDIPMCWVYKKLTLEQKKVILKNKLVIEKAFWDSIKGKI
jgi:hypothetical protein